MKPIAFYARTLACCILLFVINQVSVAQEQQRTTTDGAEHPVALRDLIAEADQKNPQIAAAEHGYQAATPFAAQKSALPDPQVSVQQFNVGSPRPFAGYTNSDFAYIGIGASQELPYPGKLRLRAQVGEREADIRRADSSSVKRDVVGKLKAAYFRLAYLQQTLSILERNNNLLNDIQHIAESRHRLAQANHQQL